MNIPDKRFGFYKGLDNLGHAVLDCRCRVRRERCRSGTAVHESSDMRCLCGIARVGFEKNNHYLGK